jgi:2-polyprenyl-3-methyl-5-hydroxy-6-metoxy-1,4-benzoquinol methylase
MLYYLKKYFKYTRAIGTQISEPALNFSREQLGLEIYGDDLLNINFNNQRFDLITIFHVLEHVKDPENYIKKIHDLLNKNGRLIIEVPNFNSWTRKLTGQYWLALDLDYHLTFFTPRSLRQLLKKYGFKIKSVRTFSLEYSAFTSTQSLISFITGSNHKFYRFIQNKRFSPYVIFHIFLFLLLFPVGLLINLLLYFSKRGESLIIIAEKL